MRLGAVASVRRSTYSDAAPSAQYYEVVAISSNAALIDFSRAKALFELSWRGHLWF